MELQPTSSISFSTTGEDAWLVVAPDLRWQSIALSGPQAVCVMGQVLLVSCTGNFTLDKPQGGFKHVRWLVFRPAMLQVVHETHRVFVLADENMGGIRNRSKRIPTEVNTLLDYLRSEDPDVVKAMVPVQLSHLRTLSRDCYVKSVEVKKGFEAALLVLNELLESCVSTKGTYEQKIEQTKIQQAVNEALAKEYELANERNKKMSDDMRKNAEDAKRQYDEAVSKIPNGWELIGMQFVNSLTTMVSNVASPGGMLGGNVSQLLPVLLGLATGGSSTAALAGLGAVVGSQQAPGAAQPSATASLQEIAGTDPALVMAEQIDDMLKGLLAALGAKGSAIKDTKVQDRKGPEFVQSMLEALEKHLSLVTKTKHVTEALALCAEGIEVAAAVKELSSKIKEDKQVEKLDELRLKLKAATKRSSALKTTALSKSAAPPPQINTPQAKKEESKVPEFQKMVLESAHEKLEVTKHVYSETLKASVEAQKMYNESSTKLAQSIAEMSTLKIKGIEFNEIKQILQRALVALSELSVHWDNLSRFFSSVNQLVESASISTNQLIDTINASSDGVVHGASVMRRTIDNSAVRTLQQQVVIYNVAKLYKEISSEHLLDPLAQLNSMIAIDSKQTEIIESKMAELASKCKAAQEAISAKIATQGAEYAEQIKSRIAQLEKAIDNSPVAKEVKAEITSNVTEAMAAVDKEKKEKQVANSRKLTFADDPLA